MSGSPGRLLEWIHTNITPLQKGCLDCLSKNLDISQASIETLSGERVDCMCRISHQDRPSVITNVHVCM